LTTSPLLEKEGLGGDLAFTPFSTKGGAHKNEAYLKIRIGLKSLPTEFNERLISSSNI